MANALPVRERAPSYFCKGAMPKITHEYAPKLWKPRIFHPRKWLKLGFKLPALPLWPGGFDLVSALLEMSRAGPRKQNRVELDGHLLSWKQFADNLRSRLSLITRHISIRGCACAFVGNSYSYWSVAAWRFSIEPTPAKRITREGRRFPLHDFKRCPQASTISENLRLFLGEINIGSSERASKFEPSGEEARTSWMECKISFLISQGKDRNCWVRSSLNDSNMLSINALITSLPTLWSLNFGSCDLLRGANRSESLRDRIETPIT